MRYYIKTGLDVKLESGWFLPGSIDFQIGAVLADDATNLFDPLHEPLQQFGASAERELESPSHKRPLLGQFFRV